MKTPTVLLTTALALCVCMTATAQNINDYTQPYGPDADTVFLFDFNSHGGDANFVVNSGPSGWGAWRTNVANDPESDPYAADNPGAGFGESIFLSGDDSWPRVDTLVTDQAVIDAANYGPALTVEAWIKPASMGAYHRIVARNNSYFLDVSGDEIDFWMARQGEDAAYAVTDGVDLQAGQWYHVAGVFTGTTIEVWVNGVRRASTDLGGSFLSRVPTTGDWLVIGAAPWQNENFNGNIDEVRISTAVRFPQTQEDTTAPVISLNGPSTIHVPFGGPFFDPVTASDDTDGDLTDALVITGDFPVDVNSPGAYVLTYNVSDAAGNPADAVVLTVIVDEEQDMVGMPVSTGAGLLALTAAIALMASLVFARAARRTAG